MKGTIMLEKWYWIAGIVMAVVAVLSLFIRSRPKTSAESRQSAKVYGQNNAVNQASEIHTGEYKTHR